MVYKIISVLISFIVISVYLVLRLNRTILQICLTEENILTYHYFFFLLYIICLARIIYILILLKLKNKNNTFFAQLKKKLDKYNVFFIAYETLFNFLGPDYTIYLVKYAKIFVEYSRRKCTKIILFFLFFPRFLVSLLLCYEVFYLECLHFYFYSLLLLLIPLLFRFFTFMLNDLGPRLVPEFRQFFEGSDSGLIDYKLKEEYSHLDIEDLVYNFYFPVLMLKTRMENFFMFQYSKIAIRSMLFFYIIQCIVWGYVVLV